MVKSALPLRLDAAVVGVREGVKDGACIFRLVEDGVRLPSPTPLARPSPIPPAIGVGLNCVVLWERGIAWPVGWVRSEGLDWWKRERYRYASEVVLGARGGRGDLGFHSVGSRSDLALGSVPGREELRELDEAPVGIRGGRIGRAVEGEEEGGSLTVGICASDSGLLESLRRQLGGLDMLG